MTPRLAILSGARAGAVDPIPGAVASIGRHPTCQIRLDAERDIEVSNRHAIVQRKDDTWTVRDLGSQQGTYLNGQRLTETQPLNDGDLLRLGASGPELQFLLSDRAQVAEPSREPMQAQPAKPALSPEELARILEEEQAGQLARDAAAAARKRQLIRLVASVAGAVAVVAFALFVWRNQAAKRAAAEAHRLELTRADSLIASVSQITVTMPAMQTSLDSARQAATRLRTALEPSGSNPAGSHALMLGLDSAVAREKNIAAAAAFDPAAVAQPSSAAIGLVVAQYADGSTSLATGFAVRRDGTGGVMLTTRQVVVNAQGDGPIKLFILMPGIAQPLTATVLAKHAVEDIALLRLQQRGGVPVVQGLAWHDPPVEAGKPVAIIGYPQPIDLPANGDWRKTTVATSTATGTAARVAAGFLTVDGWGSALAAGSPVIDGAGLVAGVVATAEPSARGRLYDAVPMAFALELLDQLQ